MERNDIILESQAGFQSGKGTMANMFAMTHIVQRERPKEEKKVYALFVDLKAAFRKVMEHHGRKRRKANKKNEEGM